MPVVFLHGVATRSERRTARAIAARDALIRAALLQPPDTLVLNPAWGDLIGPLPSRTNPIVPRTEGIQALATASMHAEERGISSDRTFPNAFIDWVDALFAESLPALPSARRAASAHTALAAARYAHRNPRPAWFTPSQSRETFRRHLSGALGQPIDVPTGLHGAVPAGFLNPIHSALQSVRPQFSHAAAQFLGDVLGYLGMRGSKSRPGTVPTLVAGTLDTARRAANALHAPLFVIGHSMGGNIAFDVLTQWRPRLVVDCLVTVGSQVALFRQLNLFPAVPAAPGKAARPENVRQWINIVDPKDVLALLCAPEFRGVKDRDYRTDAGIFGAHNAYFERASFFERLSAYTGPAAGALNPAGRPRDNPFARRVPVGKVDGSD